MAPEYLFDEGRRCPWLTLSRLPRVNFDEILVSLTALGASLLDLDKENDYDAALSHSSDDEKDDKQDKIKRKRSARRRRSTGDMTEAIRSPRRRRSETLTNRTPRAGSIKPASSPIDTQEVKPKSSPTPSVPRTLPCIATSASSSRASATPASSAPTPVPDPSVSFPTSLPDPPASSPTPVPGRCSSFSTPLPDPMKEMQASPTGSENSNGNRVSKEQKPAARCGGVFFYRTTLKRSERSSRKDTIPAIVTGKPVEFRFDSTGMDSRVETKSQGAGCFLTPRKSQESIISDSRKSSRNENKILSQESKESEDMILLTPYSTDRYGRTQGSHDPSSSRTRYVTSN